MTTKPTYDELLQKNIDLRISNKKLKIVESFFETADDGIALIGLDGRFLEGNEKVCSLLEYTNEELLQMEPSNLRPSLFQTVLVRNLGLVREQKKPLRETITLEKNGIVSFYELQTSVSKLDGERIIQFVIRDITGRTKGEKKFDLHEHIFSLTENLVAFVDRNYIYQLVNRNYSRDHNTKCDEIVGHSVAHLLGEEVFAQIVKPQLDRCFSGETVRYSAWFSYVGVGRRYRDITYTPYKLTNGSVGGAVVMIHDLTDLKLTEELRDLEHKRFSSILQAVPDGVCIVNQEFSIEYVNPVMEKEFGSVGGQKCFQYLHDSTEPCTGCVHERVFAGESIHRKWHSTINNKDYEIFYSPLQNENEIFSKVAFFHDVTQEKQVKIALAKNQRLLNDIVNNSPTVIYVKDIHDKYILVNSRFEEVFKVTNDGAKGKTDFDLFPYKQAQRFQKNDQQVLKSQSVVQIEEVVQCDDGTHTFISVKSPLFDDDGLVYAVAGISTDVSKSKKLENELQENNTLLTTLINASPDIIYFKDGAGKWLLANDAGLALFQLTGVDYQGKIDADLALYNEIYSDAFQVCIESDEEAWSKRELLSRGEERIPTPDGREKIFDIVKIPLFLDDGSRLGLVVQGHDITERRQAEKQLRQEIVARRQAAAVIQKNAQKLEEANIALRVLLKKQKDLVGEVQQNVLAQLQKVVLPYIALLQESTLDRKEKDYLDIISAHVKTIGSSFIKKLSSPDIGLTKKEVLIADLVKQGSKTKEIARLLNIQPPSVETYRNRIRKKLNLKNKNITLHQYLNVDFSSDW